MMGAMEQEPNWLTVDEFGRRVGMSARNIRAYQARQLLPPPVRRSRTAYYHEGHIRRLETIRELQRRGYNLVSITAILGLHDMRAEDDQFDRLLAQLRLLCAAIDRMTARTDELIRTVSAAGGPGRH